MLSYIVQEIFNIVHVYSIYYIYIKVFQPFRFHHDKIVYNIKKNKVKDL